MTVAKYPSSREMISETIPMSLLANFLENVGERLDEIAVEADGESYTRQMLGDDAIKFAGWLLQSGLTAGNKIAIVSPASYESIAAAIGANSIGLSVVVMDPLDETIIGPFYEELSTYQPKMVLFYDNSAAWMSAAKSYAYYVKVFLAAKPIDPFTRQRFGFRNALRNVETTFEHTIKEIKKYKFPDHEDLPTFYYHDCYLMSLLTDIINGRLAVLPNSPHSDTLLYRKPLETILSGKIS